MVGRALTGAGVAVAVAVALFAPGVVRRAEAHALHTTLTEVTLDPQRRMVRAVIRVFADDFGTASAARERRSGRTMNPATAANAGVAYVQAAFQITGADGRPITLRSCGTRQSGDLLWVCVEGSAPANPATLRLKNAMLCDLFADEVNIVRATLAGAVRSTLFTRGDGAKPIG